jgi:lysine biosynthesis protein LysW
MAYCPECDSMIMLDRGVVKVGMRIKCPECSTMLEVISLKPLELDYAFEDEEWDEEWEDEWEELEKA